MPGMRAQQPSIQHQAEDDQESDILFKDYQGHFSCFNCYNVLNKIYGISNSSSCSKSNQ